MNNFLSHVLIQNTVAEYEIYKKKDQFKAVLIIHNVSAHLPLEITFWKEGGKWRSSHLLNEHVLYQFGNSIDNHLLMAAIEDMKRYAA